MQGVPRSDSIKIIGQGFTRIGTGTTGYEGEHEQGICGATLIFWNESLITEHMKNQETSAVCFPGCGLPGRVDYCD